MEEPDWSRASLLEADALALDTLGFDVQGPWVRLRLLRSGEVVAELSGFLDYGRVAAAYVALAVADHGHLLVGAPGEGHADVDLDRVGDHVVLRVRVPHDAVAEGSGAAPPLEEGASASVRWRGPAAAATGRLLRERAPWRVRLPLAAFAGAVRGHVGAYAPARDAVRLLALLDEADARLRAEVAAADRL